MSHCNHFLKFPANPAAALTHRRTFQRRIASWLQRFWASERRRAERPDRIVPYY